MKQYILFSLVAGLLAATGPLAAGQTDPRDLPADVPTHLEQNPDYQWTPLHWAVRRGNIDRVIQLLGDRANIEARDFQGRTPLHIAVLAGHDDIVALLLDQGANVNARDDWGITPLRRVELISEARGWDRSAIARILIEAGGETTQIMP